MQGLHSLKSKAGKRIPGYPKIVSSYLTNTTKLLHHTKLLQPTSYKMLMFFGKIAVLPSMAVRIMIVYKEREGGGKAWKKHL